MSGIKIEKKIYGRCAYGGCIETAVRREWCWRHYARLRRTRRLTSKQEMTDAEYLERAIQRFWSWVDKNGPLTDVPWLNSRCWVWVGTHVNGYGNIFLRSGTMPTHRFSWEIHHGELPPKVFVRHYCGRRDCVNPEHLYLLHTVGRRRRSRIGTVSDGH